MRNKEKSSQAVEAKGRSDRIDFKESSSLGHDIAAAEEAPCG